MSNTLYMEALLDWSGILIEADPKSYAALLGKKRKAWSLPVCLSTKPYPTRVKITKSDISSMVINLIEIFFLFAGQFQIKRTYGWHTRRIYWTFVNNQEQFIVGDSMFSSLLDPPCRQQDTNRLFQSGRRRERVRGSQNNSMGLGRYQGKDYVVLIIH